MKINLSKPQPGYGNAVRVRIERISSYHIGNAARTSSCSVADRLLFVNNFSIFIHS